MSNLKLILLGTLLWQATTFSIRPKQATRPKAALAPRLFQSAVPIEADSPEQKKWVTNTNRGGAAERRQSPMASLKNLYQSYLRAIEERPLLTKGITAGVVNFLGDILAQYLQATTAGVPFVPNWLRLQTFFLCGLIYIGPYVHTWYEQLWKLGNWMEKKYDSPKKVQTMAQLIVDQTVGIAIFFSTYFYVYELIDALVNHRLPIMSAATAKITDNLGPLLITNYYFWPITNWISFTFVPVELRVLLNNVVGVLWNAFLCTKMAG